MIEVLRYLDSASTPTSYTKLLKVREHLDDLDQFTQSGTQKKEGLIKCHKHVRPAAIPNGRPSTRH